MKEIYFNKNIDHIQFIYNETVIDNIQLYSNYIQYNDNKQIKGQLHLNSNCQLSNLIMNSWDKVVISGKLIILNKLTLSNLTWKPTLNSINTNLYEFSADTHN